MSQNQANRVGKDKSVDGCGKQITNLDLQTRQVGKDIGKTRGREKKMDRDTDDLVEYVKWITGDLGVLRDRVRIAEKIIADLKTTGEESVESLLNTLYEQKARQEKLQKESDGLRNIIQSKETAISKKEDELTKLKQFVEMETSEKEVEIKNLRAEIDD